jgi:hypothetical protein
VWSLRVVQETKPWMRSRLERGEEHCRLTGRRTSQSQVPDEIENWTNKGPTPGILTPRDGTWKGAVGCSGKLLPMAPGTRPNPDPGTDPALCGRRPESTAIQLCTPRKRGWGQSMGKRAGSLGGKGCLLAGWTPLQDILSGHGLFAAHRC